MKKCLLTLIVWGVLFGYMEAAIVVYLREIYYPSGFTFPAVLIDKHIMLTELLREAATLLIMWTTVSLTYPKTQSRIAAFFLLFGVWDIFYYVFLKLLLNWPQSLETWDILFLIPLPWVGPVWAPIIISVGFIFVGMFILQLNHKNRFVTFDNKFLLIELFAASMIIFSFIIPGNAVVKQSVPTDFPYYLFLLGFLLAIGGFLYSLYHIRLRSKK
ncbi:hypothetical protein PGH07_05605 [Sulfurovum sp. zt1-1]|uniref:FAR-17a/AIG1-like protein n=1 Tax=Sulfurovum zhangzhouensis TaxID=3019067 RepID=A0ABT7QXX5_9BACT|nr:hypothetical protein [Sulfurovum zhangzhouensis]MDM5271642.1 hypothetical protein [Sulfurovum zhangzhouensis]